MPDLLVLGGTGMLGRAVMAAGRRRGLSCVSAARAGADVPVDLADAQAGGRILGKLRPRIVVNCAAVTDLDACARDPAAADLLNAEMPGQLAEATHALGGRFVQVSTDHYFTGGGRARHAEDAPVTLCNAYAASKLGGERSVGRVPGSLTLRTNVTGWRRKPGRPTFVEWAAAAVRSRAPATLFDDYFTSTIDCDCFADLMLDAVALGATGLYNLASSEVSSKFEFVQELALQMSVPTDHLARGSVAALGVRRAESCGLDVARAETLLGRRLPGLRDVVAALLAQEPGA